MSEEIEIVRDPNIMLGKPTIKGTRITVELIVRKLADGFDTNIFLHPHIGDFGQIYWDHILQMRDLQGEFIPCEYDLSPEFIYENSIQVEVAV